MDVAAGQVVILGAGLFLTLALAAYTPGARLGVGLFSYMEIRTLVPRLEVLLRSHVMITIIISQAESVPSFLEEQTGRRSRAGGFSHREAEEMDYL